MTHVAFSFGRRLELETMAEAMHAQAEEGDAELMALLKTLFFITLEPRVE